MTASAESVQRALERVAPWLRTEDEDIFSYLCGALQEADGPESVQDMTTPFLASSRPEAEAAELAAALGNALFPEPAAPSAPIGVRRLDAPVCMTNNQEEEVSEFPEMPVAAPAAEAPESSSSSKPSARERRKERKAREKGKGKSRSGSPPEGAAANGPTGLQGVAELAEVDDWASAWAEVQATGERWGGRGKGGRGIQRNTWQPRDVYVEGVTLTYLGRDLLQRTTITLIHGHCYFLIGDNGVGKTTLMRRIAAGAVPGWPLHLRVYLVQQEVLGGSENALATVLASDERLTSLLKEEAALSDPDTPLDSATAAAAAASSGGSAAGSAAAIITARAKRLEEVTASLEALEARTAEVRAKAILEGLGFDAAALARPTSALSGGWRMRVSLACALFCKPDLLLLDEPTNHLDMEGIAWVSAYLQRLTDTTVVVVSHDKAFADAVATDVILFKNLQLKYYVGNYSAYQQTREDKNLHMARTDDAISRQRKHMEESIQKMKKAASGKDGDHKKLSQVASRQKKLLRQGMEKNEFGHRFKAQSEFYAGRSTIRAGSAFEDGEVWRDGTKNRRTLAEGPDKRTLFKFPPAEPLGVKGAILQLRGVTFQWPGATAPLLANLDFTIEEGQKLSILAANGVGKSTLLALIAGAGGGAHRVGAVAVGDAAVLEPTAGEIHPYKNLKIGVFAQHHQDQLPPTSTPLQHMRASFPRESEQTLRSYLGAFGVTADLVHSPFASLSGGQRSRVVFAEVLHHRPHLLLLDEPSNHLDLATVEALAEGLQTYEGAVVLVSHDRDLVDSVSTDLFVLRGQRLQRLGGTMAEYAAGLEERARERIAHGVLG